MSHLPDESQTALTILQAELTRLRDATMEAWRGYLTWFTWFYGTQTLVLGWLVIKAGGMGAAAFSAGVVGWLCLLFYALTI